MSLFRHRERQRGRLKEHKSYFNYYDDTSFAFWTFRRIVNNINRLASIGIIVGCLKVIPAITYAFTYFDLVNDIISNALSSKRSVHTRIFKIAMAVLSLPIAIVSFIISTQITNAVAAGMNILDSLWDCATIIFSKLFGKLKNNTNPDLHRRANGKLAESVHKIFINTGFAVGAALILNPATVVLGVAVVLAVSSYTLIDRLGYNPLRWLANKMFNYPFREKKRIPENTSFLAVQQNLMHPLNENQQLKTKKIKNNNSSIKEIHQQNDMSVVLSHSTFHSRNYLSIKSEKRSATEKSFAARQLGVGLGS